MGRIGSVYVWRVEDSERVGQFYFESMPIPVDWGFLGVEGGGEEMLGWNWIMEEEQGGGMIG